MLESLTKLECNNCISLIKIRLSENLNELDCSYCPIVEIPLFEELTRLNCSYFPILELPLFNKLIVLNCSNCLKFQKCYGLQI